MHVYIYRICTNIGIHGIALTASMSRGYAEWVMAIKALGQVVRPGKISSSVDGWGELRRSLSSRDQGEGAWEVSES